MSTLPVTLLKRRRKNNEKEIQKRFFFCFVSKRLRAPICPFDLSKMWISHAEFGFFFIFLFFLVLILIAHKGPHVRRVYKNLHLLEINQILTIINEILSKYYV